jgi:hypothetical protein
MAAPVVSVLFVAKCFTIVPLLKATVPIQSASKTAVAQRKLLTDS